MAVELLHRVVDKYFHRREGGAYAWGKTAHDLLAPHVEAVKSNTEGTLEIVDVCSAFPVLPEMFRDDQREACHKSAIQIGGKLATSIQKKIVELASHSGIEIDPENRKRIKNGLSPKHSTGRRLVQAVVQDILYNPPNLDESYPIEDQLYNILLVNLWHNSHVYERVFEREAFVKQGRWERQIRVDAKHTLIQELQEKCGVRLSGQDIVKLVARGLVPHMLPLPERTHVTSLDLAEPKELLKKGRESFPKDYWNTRLYQAATLFPEHVQANALDLPISENSISLLYSFEGVPFYFGDLSKNERERFAQSIITLLKRGGRAVFFPWHIQGDPEDTVTLAELEDIFVEHGAIVTRKVHEVEALKSNMRPREQELTHHSPIFQGRKVIHSMVIEKT